LHAKISHGDTERRVMNGKNKPLKEIVEVISRHRKELESKYKIKRSKTFGSCAEGKQGEGQRSILHCRPTGVR